MYLIDTSVWISYLREQNNSAVKNLISLLDDGVSFGITSVIYQEILQGAFSQKDLERLIEYFSTQRFFHPKDSILSYQAAAKLYFTCRRKGITLRSTIDCLIAQVAIENNLLLLHNDKDFENISLVTPELRLA